MEDELIITVIATGFDSQYFHEQAAAYDDEPASLAEPLAQMDSSDDDVATAANDIDVETEQPADISGANHFASEDQDPTNIWRNVDEDESDTPAFLRRKKRKKD
jgi:hypothetical protein